MEASPRNSDCPSFSSSSNSSSTFQFAAASNFFHSPLSSLLEYSGVLHTHDRPRSSANDHAHAHTTTGLHDSISWSRSNGGNNNSSSSGSSSSSRKFLLVLLMQRVSRRRITHILRLIVHPQSVIMYLQMKVIVQNTMVLLLPFIITEILLLIKDMICNKLPGGLSNSFHSPCFYCLYLFASICKVFFQYTHLLLYFPALYIGL